MRAGIDPWSLINIPTSLFDAIVQVLQEDATEQARQEMLNDQRARLKASLGR